MVGYALAASRAGSPFTVIESRNPASLPSGYRFGGPIVTIPMYLKYRVRIPTHLPLDDLGSESDHACASYKAP
jgi:hypothetical protein